MSIIFAIINIILLFLLILVVFAPPIFIICLWLKMIITEGCDPNG